MSHHRVRAAALIAVSALAVSACGGPNDDVEETITAAETAAPTDTVTTPEAAPETSTATSTEAAPTSEAVGAGTATGETKASTSEGPVDEEEAEALEEVRERFATIAPPEFFDRLDGCTTTGMDGYYDCSGDEVGQVQFFASEAKAASTTQLLTELRSSRIVEDDGDRVVGWSTVGTSAIITVVDNGAGQVMQQLISSDVEDPRQRIYDLGLAKKS